MVLQAQCKHCGKQLQARPELAGKRVKCTQCGNPVSIPAAETPAAAADRMAIRCGQCGAQYMVDPALRGKQVKCKQCGAAVPVGGAPAPARPTAPVQAAAAAPPISSIADLLDEAGPGKLIAPPKVLPGQTICPNCHEVIPMGSAICTACGMDFRSGRQLKAGIDQPRTKEQQATIDALLALGKWFLCEIVAFGMSLAMGFGLIAVESGSVGAMAYVWNAVWLAMLTLGGAVTVLGYFSLLADALQEGWLVGLLFVFLPFYALYFICTRWAKCRKTYYNWCIARSFFFAAILKWLFAAGASAAQGGA